MLVTIHLEPGQTDRDLERALLALDPGAEVRLVTGRNGRTGVRVCGELALRYLYSALVGGVDRAGLMPLAAETVGTAVAVAEPVGVVAPEAVAVSGNAEITVEPVKSKPPAKKAAAKKATTAKPDEEVN